MKRDKVVPQKLPKIISKLRTEYCLNEYLCKIRVVEKPYCKCGEIESCEHILMECEEVQDLRERLKVKMWQLTGKDLWTMEAFLAVTNKDEYEQERFIINDILEEFLERSRRLTKTASTKYIEYRAPPNTREKVLETLYQEENTCAILRLKGQDYRITGPP